MMKATRAFALLMVMLVFPLSVSAGTLGPAFTYKELLTLAGKARDGDVLLVSGDVTATGDPLKTPALLQISPSFFRILSCLIPSSSTAFPISSCARVFMWKAQAVKAG